MRLLMLFLALLLLVFIHTPGLVQPHFSDSSTNNSVTGIPVTPTTTVYHGSRGRGSLRGYPRA